MGDITAGLTQCALDLNGFVCMGLSSNHIKSNQVSFSSSSISCD